MIKKYWFYIVSLLLVLAFVYAGITFPKILQRTFEKDSDYHWVYDCTRYYVEQKKRLPESWDDLRSFSREFKMYQPMDGMADRVEVNFQLFAELNKNGWNLENIDEPLIWVFRWKDNQQCIHQESLGEYLNLLKPRTQNDDDTNADT